MKIIYTNISPATSAYTNFNHIFYLKKHNPQKVYLCIWDLFVYEAHILNSSDEKSKKEKLKENVRSLEALMKHLGLNYEIIYLSEAWERIFKNKEIMKLYQKSLSLIDLEKIRKGFSLRYIPFGDISLSKINYIIVDYLASIFLPEIFPEKCNSQPNHYLTSERFRVFREDIDHVVKLKSRYTSPKSIYVTGVPVIIDKQTKFIPSSEMSKDTIRKIVESHYDGRLPSEKEVYELFDILFYMLDKIVVQNERVAEGEVERVVSDLDYFEFVEIISENLYCYFEELKKIISKIKVEEIARSKVVGDTKEFEKMIKPLNEIKLIILKSCDGKSSILEISKKSGIKLSTVSTYITQLRAMGLVSLDKKPKRLIENLVLNLGGIDA
ncbi:winged helix-turn-helix transcriptional regulator [Methanococcoides sp. SA1]|nr:winged helix-turn-helix transcriptional regulator [Methanococcoides sp. SA1]